MARIRSKIGKLGGSTKQPALQEGVFVSSSKNLLKKFCRTIDFSPKDHSRQLKDRLGNIPEIVSKAKNYTFIDPSAKADGNE